MLRYLWTEQSITLGIVIMGKKMGVVWMPFAIYVLGFAIFSETTSEFMVPGMMSSMAIAFGVSVTAIGYLVSAYAAGMIVGGPVLTMGLLKVQPKKAFLLLILVFLIGQTMGALTPNYTVMFIARVVTGIALSASFGVSISICSSMVKPHVLGRAISFVVGGLMVATAIGLPAASLVGQFIGWRVSFWGDAILVLLAGLVGLRTIPLLPKQEPDSILSELTVFKNRKLWAAYTTSLLIIGATFSAFSYFIPILTNLTGYSDATVPYLLAIYGIATVVGNLVVGRFANTHAITIQTIGLVTLVVVMAVFALFAFNSMITIMAVIVVGLAGVPMNPAMATRVIRSGNSGPLVNTVHTAIINLGILLGSFIGGTTIAAGYGLVSTLWVGSILALLGLMSLLPFLSGKGKVLNTFKKLSS